MKSTQVAVVNKPHKIRSFNQKQCASQLDVTTHARSVVVADLIDLYSPDVAHRGNVPSFYWRFLISVSRSVCVYVAPYHFAINKFQCPC